MARKRTGAGSPPVKPPVAWMGPVKVRLNTSPQAQHHFTRFDQVDQLLRANEAEAETGFMTRLLALCSLPRTDPGNRYRMFTATVPTTW